MMTSSKQPASRVGTWDTLKLHPMTLMKMVVEGKATVIGKDEHGRKIYEVEEEESKPGRAAI